MMKCVVSALLVAVLSTKLKAHNEDGCQRLALADAMCRVTEQFRGMPHSLEVSWKVAVDAAVGTLGAKLRAEEAVRRAKLTEVSDVVAARGAYALAKKAADEAEFVVLQAKKHVTGLTLLIHEVIRDIDEYFDHIYNVEEGESSKRSAKTCRTTANNVTASTFGIAVRVVTSLLPEAYGSKLREDSLKFLLAVESLEGIVVRAVEVLFQAEEAETKARMAADDNSVSWSKCLILGFLGALIVSNVV